MKCRQSKSSPGRFLRGDRLNGKERDDEEIRVYVDIHVHLINETVRVNKFGIRSVHKELFIIRIASVLNYDFRSDFLKFNLLCDQQAVLSVGVSPGRGKWSSPGWVGDRQDIAGLVFRDVRTADDHFTYLTGQEVFANINYPTFVKQINAVIVRNLRRLISTPSSSLRQRMKEDEAPELRSLAQAPVLQFQVRCVAIANRTIPLIPTLSFILQSRELQISIMQDLTRVEPSYNIQDGVWLTADAKQAVATSV
ncbi:hypothetical protein TcasGA2_TC015186 [Tribolium castaneum]|uniref:Uncharacterized protein n=1 Tax=Tribolium castaneum TaxID=7070 RepID=D2A5F0_TRICA|nr:hypothetical protein TcasGA2_TC015186 [Tribolium castaneum]